MILASLAAAACMQGARAPCSQKQKVENDDRELENIKIAYASRFESRLRRKNSQADARRQQNKRETK